MQAMRLVLLMQKAAREKTALPAEGAQDMKRRWLIKNGGYVNRDDIYYAAYEQATVRGAEDPETVAQAIVEGSEDALMSVGEMLRAVDAQMSRACFRVVL